MSKDVDAASGKNPPLVTELSPGRQKAERNGAERYGAERNGAERNGAPRRMWRERLLSQRIFLLLAAHVLILWASYAGAYQLRFDFSVPQRMQSLFWGTLPWVLGIKLVLFYVLGDFHGWWRYVTFADLVFLLRVSVLSTLLMFGVDWLLLPGDQIPRSVLLLDCGGTILLIGGGRSLCRLVREHVWPAMCPPKEGRALMIADGQDAEGLARLIQNDRRLAYRIVGFLDEDPRRRGTFLGGIPFLGTPEEAIELAQCHDVGHIFAIANGLSARRLRELMESGSRTGIGIKMIPPLDRLVNGSYRLELRDLDINDLLRRSPVELDTQAIHEMLCGRRVLVTGAGGSIGSEICRQIVKCRPSSLILVERSENSLFYIERELRQAAVGATLSACVVDVTDRRRMEVLFEAQRPQIIFHAAAHKHVPLMESHPGEAVANNVLGTKVVADLADAFDVERMVMISTDKAVNPRSVMGVTKQLAERYVHACCQRSQTKYVVVRFGNVLGSAGSVVPVFQDQIRRGGPLTVTHPEMKRYFMTIPEASQLVLQAASMGKGGEIYVLDMGSPVKIMDLARDLIRLSGFLPDEIPIELSGMRPGEKLEEELYFDEETTLPTGHPKIQAAYHRPFSLEELEQSLGELKELIYAPAEVVRNKLRELVPEYQHQSGPTRTTAGQPAATVTTAGPLGS